MIRGGGLGVSVNKTDELFNFSHLVWFAMCYVPSHTGLMHQASLFYLIKFDEDKLFDQITGGKS